MERESIRQELIERYLSTGKVGLTRPKDDIEALDLIETVIKNLFHHFLELLIIKLRKKIIPL